jgi:hypothetical protein
VSKQHYQGIVNLGGGLATMMIGGSSVWRVEGLGSMPLSLVGSWC